MEVVARSEPVAAHQAAAWTTNLADLNSEDLPDLEFVVEGLIPVGLTVLAAKPKMGKSFMALQLCLSVTSGSPFLECETKQGNALYVSLEDRKRRLRDRVSDFDRCPVVEGNLDVATIAPKLDDGLLDHLTGWLGSVHEPRLIVIDTLARVLPSTPGRKSEYIHVSDVLDPLQRLAFDRNIGIVVIHHSSKSETTSDVYDQILGSTAISGVADALLVLNKARPATQANLDITGRDIEERSLQLVRDGPWWAVTGTPPGAELRLSPEKQEIIEAVRSGSRTTQEIAGAVGKSYSTANKHINDLKKVGLLDSPRHGQFELTKKGNAEFNNHGGSGGSSGNPVSTVATAEVVTTAAPLSNIEVQVSSTADNDVSETGLTETISLRHLQQTVTPPKF